MFCSENLIKIYYWFRNVYIYFGLQHSIKNRNGFYPLNQLIFYVQTSCSQQKNLILGIYLKQLVPYNSSKYNIRCFYTSSLFAWESYLWVLFTQLSNIHAAVLKTYRVILFIFRLDEFTTTFSHIIMVYILLSEVVLVSDWENYWQVQNSRYKQLLCSKSNGNKDVFWLRK